MTETTTEKKHADVKVDEAAETETEKKPIEKKAEEKAKSKNEIMSILEEGAYRCIEHPNGIILGVKLHGVKGKRGVHVDIVHVVDWRKATFAGTEISMQAAILETVNRDTLDILTDVGFSDMTTTKTRRTTRGRIHLPMMMANEGHSGSLIHETRLVYVVTKDIRPTADLSWLTDGGRIVGIDSFALARQSESRAILPAINRRVNGEKWDHLERSMTLGWVSFLFLAFAVIGIFTSLMVLLSGTGSMLYPIGAILSGSSIGSAALLSSRKEMGEFKKLMDGEIESLSRVGEAGRNRESFENNADTFNRLRDMSFLMAPLMVDVGEAIEIGDIKGAVYSANQAMDEIVKHSQEDEIVPGSDEGLAMFLGTFASLDCEYNEIDLSLCYVGLSNKGDENLTLSNVVLYCSTLLNALARSGMIPPDKKSEIDDMINRRSFVQAKEELDKEIAEQSESHKMEVTKEDEDQEKGVLGDISDVGETDEESSEEATSEDLETTADEEVKAEIPTAEAVDAPGLETEDESEGVPDPESEPTETVVEPETDPDPVIEQEAESEADPEHTKTEAESETETAPIEVEIETPAARIVRKAKKSKGLELGDATKVGVMATSRPKDKPRRRSKTAA